MNTRLSRFMTILAVGSLLAAGSAYAQNQNQNQKNPRDWQKGPPSVEEKLARISDALDLSSEQSIEMLVVLQEREAKKSALHERTMEMLGPEICAHKFETEDAILAILTPEQIDTYLQIREERLENANNRGRRGRGPNDLDCAQYEGG